MENKTSTNHENGNDANRLLPAVYSSIEEAIKELGLSRRVRWKLFHGYLCRYTKKDICPEFVVQDGLPVVINGRSHIVNSNKKVKRIAS